MMGVEGSRGEFGARTTWREAEARLTRSCYLHARRPLDSYITTVLGLPPPFPYLTPSEKYTLS